MSESATSPGGPYGLLVVDVGGGDGAAMIVEDEIGIHTVFDLIIQGRYPYTDPDHEISISHSVYRFSSEKDRSTAQTMAEKALDHNTSYSSSKNKNTFYHELSANELEKILYWRAWSIDIKQDCGYCHSATTETCPGCGEGLCEECAEGPVSVRCIVCGSAVCPACVIPCQKCVDENVAASCCIVCPRWDETLNIHTCRRHDPDRKGE